MLDRVNNNMTAIPGGTSQLFQWQHLDRETAMLLRVTAATRLWWLHGEADMKIGRGAQRQPRWRHCL
jgi:hypothetical protein